MKKIISILLCTAVLSSTFTIFAQDMVQEDATPIPASTEVPTSEATDEPVTELTDSEPAGGLPVEEIPKTRPVSVSAVIADTPYRKVSDVTLELLSEDGKVLDKETLNLGYDTKTLVFTFDAPEYEIGTSFKVRATNGVFSVQYYNDVYHIGQEMTLPTYYYIDNNGNNAESTDISVTINPLYDKSVNLYYNADWANGKGARVINGSAMIPARAVAEFIGFNVRYDEQYNVEVITLDGKEMLFNVGTAYTTVFGTDLFAPESTVMIDGTVYISLRTFADAIGSELDVRDYGTYMDINMSESVFVKEYFSRLPINSMNVSSRTNYMVWVSLSEYKTRLYQGSKNHWKPLLEATCGIGAPGTPTVTGSFEYSYKTRWDYGTYYVGPCLVFYRGYALHSVLLYQNGTEYDGRVGMKLSHGCIRLKKKDIDFIANTIPVGTKIYITP